MLLLFTVMGALSAVPDASTSDRRTAVAVVMITIAGSAAWPEADRQSGSIVSLRA